MKNEQYLKKRKSTFVDKYIYLMQKYEGQPMYVFRDALRNQFGTNGFICIQLIR